MRPVTLRILLFITSLILVPSLTYLVILFARGYRPDLPQKKLQATGILVATSIPDGAQIVIDGQLVSATNTSLNLPPKSYQVEVKKDGFQSWKKQLELQAEVVTRAAATLYPSVPSLKAVTTSGASRPVLAPDGTKVAFVSGSKIYTLDLTESPLGLISRDPKLATSHQLKAIGLTWSPDSKYILVSATASASLVDISNSQITDATLQLKTLKNDWQKLQDNQDKSRLNSLPDALRTILSASAADLAWAPSEKKLLYTATASAVLPDRLKNPLPGSNTQEQSRELIPGRVYVYDLEEDRNFAVGEVLPPSPTPKPPKKSPLVPWTLGLDPLTRNGSWQWLPDSSHLVKTQDKQIAVKEYDNSNQTVVYAGPMEGDFVAPYPSGKQLLILSNLNPSLSALPNLYALSLR